MVLYIILDCKINFHHQSLNIFFVSWLTSWFDCMITGVPSQSIKSQIAFQCVTGVQTSPVLWNYRGQHSLQLCVRARVRWLSHCLGYRSPFLQWFQHWMHLYPIFPGRHSLSYWGKISRCYKSKKRGLGYCRNLEQYLDSVSHIYTKPAFLPLLFQSYVTMHHYLRNISVLIVLIRTKWPRNVQPK